MTEQQALQRIEEDRENTELVPHQPPQPPSLFGTADPVEVVARASRVAASLKEVIKAQGLISKISGKEYPRCEAWTLLGTMLGVFPVLVWSRPVEGGWEARVEARTRDGAIVGAAEAQCLKTERNWRERDDFALRSMAQTRATAKALRMPLGFVMTLSGVEPTPAEEMTFEQSQQPKQRQQAAQQISRRTSDVPQKSKPVEPPAIASEEQRLRWIAELKLRGDWALGYCYDKAWLMPESGPDDDRTPAEPIESLEARHVPTTRKAADAILAELDSLIPEDQRPSRSSKEASKEPINDSRAYEEHSGDESNQPEDGVEVITGKLEAVSKKDGRSGKGPWTRYGVKVGEEWFGTFSKPLGELAAKDKGHTVRIQFRRGDRGNDLVSIERA